MNLDREAIRERMKTLTLALGLGIAAFICGACDKEYEEEEGVQGFPSPVHVSFDGTTAHVQVAAATVGTASTASGGSAGFNAYGNAYVGATSSDTHLNIKILHNGRWRHKRIANPA